MKPVIDLMIKFPNKANKGAKIKEDIKDIKSIKFDNMSFSSNTEKELIKDFSLKITKGSKVAIVGPTGAGKTTLINLIMRFYEPINGKILFNDISSKDISLSNLRKHFGMVLQDTWIFSGTILDNIKGVGILKIASPIYFE